MPPDLPATTIVTGAWLDRSAPAPLPDRVEAFLDEGAAPIVIAFGSMAGASDEVIGAAVESLLDAGRRVIVQGALARSVASPNLLRSEALDHRALLPRAGLVVHHGGAGTTHAACAAGVPSLVVPHVGDQPYWAERLRRLGVAPAPHPARRLRADELADAALAAASDRDMRAAAQRLGERIGHEDGLEAAVAAIESAAG